jgi:hypothetical protein
MQRIGLYLMQGGIAPPSQISRFVTNSDIGGLLA